MRHRLSDSKNRRAVATARSGFRGGKARVEHHVCIYAILCTGRELSRARRRTHRRFYHTTVQCHGGIKPWDIAAQQTRRRRSAPSTRQAPPRSSSQFLSHLASPPVQAAYSAPRPVSPPQHPVRSISHTLHHPSRAWEQPHRSPPCRSLSTSGPQSESSSCFSSPTANRSDSSFQRVRSRGQSFLATGPPRMGSIGGIYYPSIQQTVVVDAALHGTDPKEEVKTRRRETIFGPDVGDDDQPGWTSATDGNTVSVDVIKRWVERAKKEEVGVIQHDELTPRTPGCTPPRRCRRSSTSSAQRSCSSL